MIIFDEAHQTFTLHTAATTYQCMVGPYGVLLHLYYGQRLQAAKLGHLLVYGDRGFSGNPHEAGADRSFSLDTLPQEFPSAGVGDYRVGPLGVVNANGSRAADLRYAGHRILPGKYALPGLPALYHNQADEAETLEITLRDAHSGLEAALLYGVFPQWDVITRAVRLTNTGPGALSLTRALSLCLDVPFGEWQLMHFYGRHNMERQCERAVIAHGITRLRSSRGTSSHHHNPALILCQPHTDEDAGQCYGLNLVYSGNHTTDVELDQMNQLRVVMGQGDDSFSWRLAPGEQFTTPEVACSFSAGGLGRLSRNFHAAYRHNLCRGPYKQAPRPVLVNNWEATYFNFDDEKLLDIARAAKQLGIEMLVMDDGWFGRRDSDTRALGDWTVNLQKLPGGLSPLIQKVNHLGLKFGIWVEPEMVSEDSELYRRHPDWALAIPGRPPARSRAQLVLDMARSEVRAHLYDAIAAILDSGNVAYVKWDMNRSISDWYSPALPAERQGELPHRYMLGVYELLERLTTAYPKVLFEGCSGGGGRFDPGMLYYHPQIWCSDNTDALDRLRIQYGTSFFYPLSATGAHVSAVPNHQTGRQAPLHTRGVVAMGGCLGYELDITRLSAEAQGELRAQVAFYKRHRRLIAEGSYYRLASPFDAAGLTAWLVVAEDQRSFLLSAVCERVHGNPPPQHLWLKGLMPAAVYMLNGAPYSGEVLMCAGLTLPALHGDAPALQLYGQAEG